MNVTFGDIFLADFEPSVGREYKKKRPAIVIQEQWVSSSSPLITIMPMSSRIEKMGTHDIFVQMDLKNRLTNDSVIRVNQISSFDPRRLIHHIGRAGSPTIRAVRGYLRRHFGL